MKTLACDRCFKIKDKNDSFANVMVRLVDYDLCEECYDKFKKLSEPYEKAIKDIELALLTEQMRFINEYRA